MRIEALALFLSVAQHRSISCAARQHYISQQGASAMIKSLEQELEVSLFDRTPTGLQLTGAGQAIAKEAADLHTNVFSQFVVLDYLRHNDLDEHLVKIRDLYRDQAQAMTDAMAEFFPAEVAFTKPQGGMFLWATLPAGINTMDLFPKALARCVAFVPGEPFYAEPGSYSTMRLNFTNADADTIRDGIRRLGEVIAEAL